MGDGRGPGRPGQPARCRRGGGARAAEQGLLAARPDPAAPGQGDLGHGRGARPALVMVIFAPYFTLHDPYDGSVLRRLKPVGTPGYWLGTDEVGRDLWSRMLYGGRLSLLAGVVPVASALLIGGFLGTLAGYSGGLVNSAVMRLADVLYAFPSVLLAIAITGIL